MARVLIAEPSAAIAELIAIVVGGLGHEPVLYEGDQPGAVDLLVLEPEFGPGLGLARALRRERPDLPILCVSAHRPNADSVALDPVAHLMKPCSLAELEGALGAALRSSHRMKP